MRRGGKKGAGKQPGDPTGAGNGPGGSGQGSGDRPSSPDTPDDFTPEDIHGRIDPKGRLTVTTFRGLPRPGEVTIELQEALQRARDEAQAPLESEEIPRRYRDGIREYFDDLGRAK
jgi:hypothetical protein